MKLPLIDYLNGNYPKLKFGDRLYHNVFSHLKWTFAGFSKSGAIKVKESKDLVFLIGDLQVEYETVREKYEQISKRLVHTVPGIAQELLTEQVWKFQEELENFNYCRVEIDKPDPHELVLVTDMVNYSAGYLTAKDTWRVLKTPFSPTFEPLLWNYFPKVDI